jgi:hypothetical protein
MAHSGDMGTKGRGIVAVLRSTSRAGRARAAGLGSVMIPWRASNEGFVTPDVLDWCECFACGRPGAIAVEETGIRDVPRGPLLRIGNDPLSSRVARSGTRCTRSQQRRNTAIDSVDRLSVDPSLPAACAISRLFPSPSTGCKALLTLARSAVPHRRPCVRRLTAGCPDRSPWPASFRASAEIHRAR